MSDEIVRWPLEVVPRPRRQLDERLLLAAPWLVRAAVRRASRQPAGARFRRAVLTRGQTMGWESTNRRDWDVAFLPFHPEYEFRFRDDPTRAGPDIRAEYDGHAGVRELLETWFAGFDELRFEPREVLDSGGAKVATHVDQVGRARGGIEVHLDIWNVWRLRDGLIVRQEIYWSEEPALEALGNRMS